MTPEQAINRFYTRALRRVEEAEVERLDEIEAARARMVADGMPPVLHDFNWRRWSVAAWALRERDAIAVALYEALLVRELPTFETNPCAGCSGVATEDLAIHNGPVRMCGTCARIVRTWDDEDQRLAGLRLRVSQMGPV